MSDALTLISSQLSEMREDVRDARDAARGAEDRAKGVETSIGVLLGDVSAARRSAHDACELANEAITRVIAVEVRQDERKMDRTTKWAFAGTVVLAASGLLGLIYQTIHSAKAQQPAQEPRPVPAMSRPGVLGTR
jgi:hypothetical protein